MKTICVSKSMIMLTASLFAISGGCVGNKSKSACIDDNRDGGGHDADTSHIADGSTFLSRLGLSPDTITFDDIKKFEHHGGISLAPYVANVLIGNCIYDDISGDTLGIIGKTMIGVVPVNDNCLIGAYRIDNGDGQNIYFVSYNQCGKIQDCVFTGFNWGYGAAKEPIEPIKNVEEYYSDETFCNAIDANRFAITNTFIQGEHNILTDSKQETFRRENRFEYTIKPNGQFVIDTSPKDFASALKHNEIQLCDTLYLYYDYYLRFPMSDNSVFNLWDEASRVADGSLAESLSWHIKGLLNRNPPQLLNWILEHKGHENLSAYLYNEFLGDDELKSAIGSVENESDRKYLEQLFHVDTESKPQTSN